MRQPVQRLVIGPGALLFPVGPHGSPQAPARSTATGVWASCGPLAAFQRVSDPLLQLSGAPGARCACWTGACSPWRLLAAWDSFTRCGWTVRCHALWRDARRLTARLAATAAATAAAAATATSLWHAALSPVRVLQLCATDRQLTLNVLNELLGLLGAWLRGEQYHGQHHMRGASSSLRPVGEGLADLIGNTPLIRLASLSEQTGCQVRWAGWACSNAQVSFPQMHVQQEDACGAPPAEPCRCLLLPLSSRGPFRLGVKLLDKTIRPERLHSAISPSLPAPQILAKAEFLNPGGSVKDRVALEIIQEALAEGRLRPGGLVTEGTVGSTGVSLAMCAAAFGCHAFIAMPDDAAIEKAQMLQVTTG